MRSIKNFTMKNLPVKNFMVGTLLAASVVGLTACSSGGTSAGIGLDVAGLWSGAMTSGSANIGLTVQITQEQPVFADDSVIGTQDIKGVVSVGNNAGACLSGGVMNGTIAGNNIDFVAGNTTYSGSYANGRISGLWSAPDCSPSSGSWQVQ